MDDLTREQQKLLTSMYKEVLIRQPAVSFDEANYFANSDVVMDHFCPDSDSDHVSAPYPEVPAGTCQHSLDEL